MTSGPAPHQWLQVDEGGATWLFDLVFLRSNYRCVYGQGCPSIEPEPDPTGTLGCCTHGAHLVDGDDRRAVAAQAERLEADEWAHRAWARKRGGPIKQQGKDRITRMVDGACVFLNPAGFPGGAGCALHLGALARGERPIDWKPAVCWQVPIRLDIHTDEYGYETNLVRAWQRRDWGPGGEDFGWWCTEEPTAHVGTSPVYLTARDELIELCGRAVYDRLVEEIVAMAGDTDPGVAVVIGPE
ncbi:MAG: hypothetical protein ACK5RL_12970 [Acidimicrobiales bacterium]